MNGSFLKTNSGFLIKGLSSGKDSWDRNLEKNPPVKISFKLEYSLERVEGEASFGRESSS